MKKTPGDIITLQMRTINDNYMMYGSWYKEYKGHKFLSFWIIFWSFTPLTTWKISIFKIWKNCLELPSFYKSIPKIMIICYTVIEIWHVTDVVFIFWTFTNSNNKSKFFKNEKSSWRYHHFTHVYQKSWSHDVQFLRYGAWQMDWQTDWRMEKVTYGGGCSI